MPPKCKFTKEQIVSATLDLIRTEGYSAVTARSVAAALDSSPKVIFSAFQNMEELLHETLIAANKLYESYLAEDMQKGEYPAYKASGMAYIRFAAEEKELFRLLFMRDRSKEPPDFTLPEDVLSVLRKATGMTHEQAQQFHLRMWIYVHGIATMIATNFLTFTTEEISALISDVYSSMKPDRTEDVK